MYEPMEVLDVGCGPGIYVDALVEQGIAAVGIDIDPRIKNKDYIVQESLFDTKRSSELVLCLEVAEHIDPKLSDDIVSSIVGTIRPGGTLIWSAAHPGQGGIGHINCQPKEYWEDLFLSSGLVRNLTEEEVMVNHIKSGYHMGWFIQNGMIFTKPK